MARPNGDPERIRSQILEFFTKEARSKLLELTPSRALKEGMLTVFLRGSPLAPEVVSILHYQHYWAVYLHDGHGPIQPVFANKLVFYNNPNDDPRIQPVPGGYPVKPGQAKRLTAAQYKHGLAMNRLRHAQGLDPFMWVLSRSGPFDGYHWLTSGSPFTGGGMDGTLERLAPTAASMFDRWVKTKLAFSESLEAKARLR